MIRRRIRSAVAAAVLVLALAACASIPDAGPVQQGGPVAQVNDPLDLDFNPSPPEKGADPASIVQGFVDAASSPKNNFAIAREYLTGSAASAWDPDASVIVDDGRGRKYASNGSVWNLQVGPVATVDSVGSSHPAESRAPVSLTYELVKERGEWRIAVAPDGVVIDDPTFRAVYAQQTLYFYSPDFRYLVPDVRWFPARVAAEATRVTSAVVTGPAAWLTGAVVSAFPQGTQLALPSVTVSGGVAHVDLSSEAGQADQLQLQRMQLQLQQSLGSLATEVDVSVGGAAQQIPPLADAATPIQDPTVDSHPVVVRGGDVGLLSGATIVDIGGLSDKIAALRPTALALNAARDQAAVAAADGAVYLVRRASDPVNVDARAGLIPPALDNRGWAWSVPAAAPAAVQVSGVAGGAHPVKVDWPGATGILGMAVSRDGSRVVALLQNSAGYSLAAAGVVRDADGLPTELTQPVELTLGAGTPLSVAWTSESKVAVLSATNGDATSITEQTIGGSAVTTSGPAAGRSIVGAGGLVRTLVLTADGSLQAPTGTGWQTQADRIGAVAVQMGQP